MILLGSLVASVVQNQAVFRTFTYVANTPLKSVALAGDFNGWNKGATPMTLAPDGRTWSRTESLSYGKHTYKFVLDGERWIVDPKGKSVDDGNGNVNSEIVVLPEGYDSPAKADDGVVNEVALQHTPGLPYANLDRGWLTLRLRVRPNDVSGASVTIDPNVNGRRIPMRRVSRDEVYEYYEATIRVPKGPIKYLFHLQDGANSLDYGSNGLGDTRSFVYDPATAKRIEVPSWPEGGVVYQLFPDRFANGDKGNDLPGTLPWDATDLKYDTRLGGDVAGIRAHLPYLQRLGIGTLYTTPVFDSPSYHRYDARSFTRVAPDFGTNADFALLTKQLRAKGIRTVMDFAFNHTATDGPWFTDLREKGAASEYRDFYFPKSFPIEVKENPNYVAWFGFPSMPKLNTANPAVQRAEIAAVDYWRTNGSLAGVRLDVANEVDPSLWRALRTHEKGLDKDFWIVGENWGDGTPWFGGDQWDSQMGYQFRDAALGFFAEGKTKPSEFLNRLLAIYAMYPPQVSRNLMTLIGSHDTPRFLTLCKDDGDLMRLAATVQLSWPGAPMIYYGDEIGMTGGADPMNRKGMEWPRANDANPMLRFYRRMIAVRKVNPALQSGDPSILFADDAKRTLAYARTLGSQSAFVVVNRSASSRTVSIPLPAPLRGKAALDALSGRRYVASQSSISVILGPEKAAVLVPASGPNLLFQKPY